MRKNVAIVFTIFSILLTLTGCGKTDDHNSNDHVKQMKKITKEIGFENAINFENIQCLSSIMDRIISLGSTVDGQYTVYGCISKEDGPIGFVIRRKQGDKEQLYYVEHWWDDYSAAPSFVEVSDDSMAISYLAGRGTGVLKYGLFAVHFNENGEVEQFEFEDDEVQKQVDEKLEFAVDHVQKRIEVIDHQTQSVVGEYTYASSVAEEDTVNRAYASMDQLGFWIDSNNITADIGIGIQVNDYAAPQYIEGNVSFELNIEENEKHDIAFSLGNCTLSGSDMIEGNATEQDSMSENEELENNEMYVFEDTDESNLAAITFLGYGNEEKEKNFSTFCEKYGFDAQQFEEVVDADDCEWYAIIPKYQEEDIEISHIELSEDGELVKTEQLLITSSPIIIGCNFSDIIPSVEVSIAYKDEQFSFNPFISLDSGCLSDYERLYSIP